MVQYGLQLLHEGTALLPPCDKWVISFLREIVVTLLLIVNTEEMKGVILKYSTRRHHMWWSFYFVAPSISNSSSCIKMALTASFLVVSANDEGDKYKPNGLLASWCFCFCANLETLITQLLLRIRRPSKSLWNALNEHFRCSLVLRPKIEFLAIASQPACIFVFVTTQKPSYLDFY
jgi:hypothetical protein